MLRMGNKGQIVLYVILGVLLLILAGIIFFNPTQIEPVLVSDIELSNVRTNAKFYVEVCLDQTTLLAVDEYGFLNADDKIAGYINENLLGCLNDFDVLRIQGFKIDYQEPQANVILNDNVLFVDLWFPVTLSKGDKQVSIEDFQYTLKRRVTLKTIDGMIPAGTTFFSEDEDFVLVAEQDTYVYDAEGNKAKQITLKINDKLFNGLKNDIVVGNVIYEGLADGLTFSPPLKGNLRIRKKDLPIAYPPESAKLSWFDKSAQIWKSYLFQEFGEDKDYYYYSALIDHFTPISVVICSEAEGSFQYPMSYVYRQPITPGDDPLWRNNPEGSDFKEGRHLIPEVMNNASCTEDPNMIYDAYSSVDEGSLCKIGGLLRDWDEDDKKADVNEYNKFLYDFKDKQTNSKNLDVSSEVKFQKDDADYNPNSDCYEVCKGQALIDLKCYFFDEGCDNSNIKEPFSSDKKLQFDPYTQSVKFGQKLISGDGIFDDANIKCEITGNKNGDIYNIDGTPMKCVIDENYLPDQVDLESDKIKIKDIFLSIKSTLDKEDVSNKFYATPMTYGYEKVDNAESSDPATQNAKEESHDHVGGKGYFEFNIESGGNGCIDESQLNPFIEKNKYQVGIYGDQSASENDGKSGAALFDRSTGVIEPNKIDDVWICDSGDVCTWKLNDKQELGSFKLEGTDTYAGKLVAGKNYITVGVKNAKNTYAYGQAYLYIAGKGISQEKSDALNNVGGKSSGSLSAPGNVGSQMGGAATLNLQPGDFQKIFPGIEIKAVDTNINPEIQLPRHVIYYVVKIDLEQPGIGFYVTPKSDSLQGTSTFMTNYLSKKLVVAINGGGFEWGGGNENVNGYSASEGQVYSSSKYKPIYGGGPTLEISQNNIVTMGKKNEDGMWHAITGFQTVLKDGKVEPRFDDPNHKDHKPGYDIKDPRTSIGLVKKESGEGYKYMLFITVDGRGESQGVDLKELALLHLYHKADIAANMDGGGSTTLVVNNNGVPAIVNKPSDPQGERAVANHLGVTLDLQLAQAPPPTT